MEIKNEQNISDILDSFVNTIKGVEQAYPNRYTNFVKWFHQSNIH